MKKKKKTKIEGGNDRRQIVESNTVKESKDTNAQNLVIYIKSVCPTVLL